MKKLILSAFLLFINFSIYSQDEKKLDKYLKVFVNKEFNANQTISFELKNPGKGGWEQASLYFKNAFVSHGFSVVDSKAGNPKYTIIVDYAYFYLIYAYKMQYAKLAGSIVDNENNLEVVGTFTYQEKFDLDALPDVIASKLSKHVSSNTNTPKETNINFPSKSKEDKLREVKLYYEKELITKDEYEEQKRKILSE